jgi:hypothetical protein
MHIYRAPRHNATQNIQVGPWAQLLHESSTCTVLLVESCCGSSRHPLVLVGWGTGDVEPLVDAGVDRGGCLVLALGDVELAGIGTVGRVRDSGVGPATLLVTLTGERLN